MALRAIYVDYFPTRNDIDVFPTLEPRELSAAFQHLEQVDFLRYNHEGYHHPYHTGDEQPGLIEYMGALFSSPRLKHVSISLQRYSTYNLRDSIRSMKPMMPPGMKDRLCQPAPALTRLDAHGLRTLTLTHISFCQAEWDAFCEGLGDRLEEVTLRNIELSDGSWGPSLDVLRRKTESRCLEGKCNVEMIRIGGSEFECDCDGPRLLDLTPSRGNQHLIPKSAGGLLLPDGTAGPGIGLPPDREERCTRDRSFPHESAPSGAMEPN